MTTFTEDPLFGPLAKKISTRLLTQVKLLRADAEFARHLEDWLRAELLERQADEAETMLIYYNGMRRQVL